jgi:hypothetical protein
VNKCRSWRSHVNLNVGISADRSWPFSNRCSATSPHFVGYAGELTALPGWILIVMFVGGLGALAAWGISQAMWKSAHTKKGPITGPQEFFKGLGRRTGFALVPHAIDRKKIDGRVPNARARRRTCDAYSVAGGTESSGEASPSATADGS